MAGADNLIDHCLGGVDGMTVGLVAERPELGWYDAAIADELEQRITEKGGRCHRLASNGPANKTDPRITALEEQVDALIFLCRSGIRGVLNAKPKPSLLLSVMPAIWKCSPAHLGHSPMMR